MEEDGGGGGGGGVGEGGIRIIIFTVSFLI